MKNEIDYSKLVDFEDNDPPHITFIMAAEDMSDEVAELMTGSRLHREDTIEGKTWHAARFTSADAAELQELNELIGMNEDVITLVNGNKAAFARSMWAPMMYIFSAGKQEEVREKP